MQYRNALERGSSPRAAVAGLAPDRIFAMARNSPRITHVDRRNRPRMVDIGGKAVTQRSAQAQALVRFPADVATAVRGAGMASKKGPIVDTAIVAGTLAVKRTHELVPFCHPLAIERCEFDVDWVDDCTLAIPSW